MKGGDRRAGRASTGADIPASDAGHPLPRNMPAGVQPGPVIISAAADEVALAALSAQRESNAPTLCDVCERAIHGEPSGSGLYFWTRDGEARWEEPALCARCAPAIGLTALKRFASEDEGGE